MARDAAGVARDAGGRDVEHGGQPAGRPIARRVDDDERPDGLEGDHGAGRVRARIAERAEPIGDDRPPRHVDLVLADPGVGLALAPEPQLHVPLDAVEVVQPVGQLELRRAPVAQVHQRVDARQLVALPDPAQQRLRRRPRLGGVEAQTPVHRARGGQGLLRRAARAQRGGRRGERRVELRVARPDRHLIEGEHAETDGRGDVRAEAHGGHQRRHDASAAGRVAVVARRRHARGDDGPDPLGERPRIVAREAGRWGSGRARSARRRPGTS